MKLFRIFIVVIFAFNAFLLSAQNPDDVILVDRDDSAMEKAFQKANETLDTFIDRATNKRSENEIYGAYIKVEEGDVVEYLWVSDFQKHDDIFYIGVLITEPSLTNKFENGATIGFEKKDIFDWQIYNKVTDVLEGAFTFEALE